MPIAVNDAGDALYLGGDGKWQPAPRAVNDKGETLLFDGQSWVGAPGKAAPAQPTPTSQRGPATQGAFSRMLSEHENTLSAAKQGTTPNIDVQSKNALGEATIDEEGNVLVKGPNGQLLPTDTSKHVTLRDPATGRQMVYARTEDTAESPAVGVARTLAPGLAAGAVTARPGIAGISAAAQRPKASDIFSTAKPYYRAFEKEAENIAVPGPSRAAPKDYLAPMTGAKPIEGAIEHQGLGGRIRDVLNKKYIPEQAQEIYAATKLLDKGDLTLDQLQNVKQIIGNGFRSADERVRDAAGIASKELMKAMGEVSPTAAKNLKTADEIHQTALAMQDLQRKEAVAGLRTGRAGYGGNAVNSMRQVLSPVVEASIKGRSTAFKPDEIAAMRDIVEGTGATNMARLIGQASPSKGIIQTMGSGGAIAALGPIAATIPALGAAANKLATILTGRQIERLKDLVAKRSPAYAQAVEKAVARYDKAQAEFASDPSPARLAGYVSASRALSSGLSKDGMAVSSGDLLRSISGPVRAPAEEEQPNPEGVINP